MDNNKHKHHHGRHHSHHMDESEKFKIHTLSASKRRKIIGKVLFVLLSIVAVAIMLFVAWIYTHNLLAELI